MGDDQEMSTFTDSVSTSGDYIPPIVYQPLPPAPVFRPAPSVFRPAPQQRVSVVLKKEPEKEKLILEKKEELMKKPARKMGLLVLGGLVAAAGLGWFLWREIPSLGLGSHEGRGRGGRKAHCC